MEKYLNWAAFCPCCLFKLLYCICAMSFDVGIILFFFLFSSRRHQRDGLHEDPGWRRDRQPHLEWLGRAGRENRWAQELSGAAPGQRVKSARLWTRGFERRELQIARVYILLLPSTWSHSRHQIVQAGGFTLNTHSYFGLKEAPEYEIRSHSMATNGNHDLYCLRLKLPAEYR